MNRKGFADIVWVAIAGLGLLLGMFGPKLVASFGDVVNGGNKNQTKQVHKVDLKYTMGYMDEKGKFIKVGDYSKREDMQNIIAEQPKEKWSTKVMIIVGFLLVLAIAFPSKAVQLLLQGNKNFKQIIVGLEEGLNAIPPEQAAIVKTNLSKKMDTKAKEAVKKVKVKL